APKGIRGVSAQTRGGSWGSDPSYLHDARSGTALVLQIESLAGVRNAEDIMRTDGVDAVFLGAADLAASMGYLGQPNHPEVLAAAAHVVELAVSLGIPIGTLTKSPAACSEALANGYAFAAVGTDTAMLAASYRQTLQQLNETSPLKGHLT
ncbi:MAG: aldolase/citrate lyase family protein, partial [Arthrobacter sp.]